MRLIFIWGFGMATMLFAPLLILVSSGELRAGDPVLVVSTPWGPDAAEVIGLTGLHEVSPERAPLGALTEILVPEDVRRLKENGALFVVGGSKVAQLCAE